MQQLAIIVNPQWELKGNLFSDFGLGATKQRREALAASFVDSYYLRQLRVYGDDMRVLRAYPGKFQVGARLGLGARSSVVIACMELLGPGQGAVWWCCA